MGWGRVLHGLSASLRAKSAKAALWLRGAGAAMAARRPSRGPFAMFRPIYDWTLRLAGHRHAIRWLALISFAESSFFPTPPDVLVIPMVLARRDQAWLIAAVVTASSVLGGIAGYFIGAFLYDSVDRKSTRLNSSHVALSRMPPSA